MSLTKEIRKVHNELYKTVNGNIKVLLPMALTLLDTYKTKVRTGVAEPVEETATEFKRTSKQVQIKFNRRELPGWRIKPSSSAIFKILKHSSLLMGRA